MKNKIDINPQELTFSFIPSPGPGGQNVNKVATAAVLRFNVVNSKSINNDIREKLLKQFNKKFTSQGELIIKAYRFRTQERNKQDAIERLQKILQKVANPTKQRKKTIPTQASIEARLKQKKIRSDFKVLRNKSLKDEY